MLYFPVNNDYLCEQKVSQNWVKGVYLFLLELRLNTYIDCEVILNCYCCMEYVVKYLANDPVRNIFKLT